MKILIISVMALVLLLVGCGGATPTAAPTSGQTQVVPATPSATVPQGSGQATLEIRVTDAPPKGFQKSKLQWGA